MNWFSGMRLDSFLQEVKKTLPIPGLLALAEDFPHSVVAKGGRAVGRAHIFLTTFAATAMAREIIIPFSWWRCFAIL